MFDPYPENATVPMIHPIIGYLASLWDVTPNKNQFFDAIDLEDIAAACKAKEPLKNYEEFQLADLTSFVNDRICPEQRWWLQPAALGISDGAGMLSNTSDILPVIGSLTCAQIWPTQASST